MKMRILLSAICAMGLLWVSPHALALNPNHDCSFCHNLHGAPGQTLLNNAVVETLCLSCHGAAGIATRKAEVHTNKPGSAYSPFTQTCTDCHTPHSNEENWLLGINLELVKAQIVTPNSGTKEVVFESRGLGASEPSLHSFSDNDEDGNGIYDGACAVCHTQTTHHLNTGDPFIPTHDNVGKTCTDCHGHTSNFAPGGGACDSCHNSAQDNLDGVPPGGRRIVMDDFLSSTSGHIGTDIAAPEDCEVCHQQDNHQLGYVRLNNVDTGATIATQNDLDTNSVSAAVLTEFCLACHDSDGANGDLTPFSDNVSVPDIDAGGFFASGSHNNIGALSCYGDGSTFGCHGNGHGSQKMNLLAPSAVPATAPDYGEEEEGFCFNCHNSGGIASTDIETLFAQVNHHKVVWSEQSGDGRDLECTSCHDQHWASTIPVHTDGNLASGKIADAWGINAAGGVVGAITYEYELCFRCHSNYAGAGSNPGDGGPDPIVNKAVQFNTGNATYHPVMGAQNNPYTTPTAMNGNIVTMKAPWNQTGEHDTIWCSDCHRDANISGTHGSINPRMLRASLVAVEYDLDTELPDPGGRNQPFGTPLCVECHDMQVYLGGDNGSRFSAHNNSNHLQPEWSGGGGGCLSCHFGGQTMGSGQTITAIHGGANNSNNNGGSIDPGFMNGSRQVNWTPGSCTVVSSGAVGGDSGCKGHTKSY